MKHILLIVFVFLNGFVSAQKESFNVRKFQKHLAKVTDSLYASKTEVSNGEYTEFLNYLKEKEQLEIYAEALIDSSKWQIENAYMDPMVKFYHTHPAYSNYPLVNISYEGATYFCNWVTEKYNSQKKRKFKKVKFRLPSEEEWVKAARAGNSMAIFPWDGEGIITRKGQIMCNLKRIDGVNLDNIHWTSDHADLTAPVESYWPNDFGIYNMSGNVAEMILEKGKTKGGSWRDVIEGVKIDGVGKFSKIEEPNPAVGFRYFMEVIEM